MPRHPDLAATARLELQARQRDPTWPADDTAAWTVIAELLERGEVETDLEWPALVDAARQAEDRRITQVEQAKSLNDPNIDAIAARFVAVANIRRTLERSAWRRGFCLPSQEKAA